MGLSFSGLGLLLRSHGQIGGKTGIGIAPVPRSGEGRGDRGSGKGGRQICLEFLAGVDVDQQPAAKIEAQRIVRHVLRQELAVGIEGIIKETAGGVDQTAARGDKAPELIGVEHQAIGAGLQLQLPDGVAAGKIEDGAVDQVKLADLAGETGEQHLLLLGLEREGAQIEAALLPLPGVVEHAVGVVELRHGALQDQLPGAAQGIDRAVGVVDVELTVPCLDPAAAGGQHVRGLRAQDACRIEAFRRGKHKRTPGAAKQQHREQQRGQSVKQVFHGVPPNYVNPMGRKSNFHLSSHCTGIRANCQQFVTLFCEQRGNIL